MRWLGRRDQCRGDWFAQHPTQVALDIMREFAGAKFCEMDAVIGAQHSDLSGFIGAALDEIVALVNDTECLNQRVPVRRKGRCSIHYGD